MHVKKNTARGPAAYLELQPSKVLKEKKIYPRLAERHE